jgi:hypothetical protein
VAEKVIPSYQVIGSDYSIKELYPKHLKEANKGIALSNPKGKSITGSSGSTFDLAPITDFRLLENLYYGVSEVQKSIDSMAIRVSDIERYELTEGSTDDNVLFLAENFGYSINIEQVFEEIARELLIYGNSIWEIVTTGENGEIDNLKRLDPATMKIRTNDKGQVIGWVQTVNNQKIPFKPDQIAHFYIRRPRNSLWGRGVLAAVAKDIENWLNIQRDTTEMYHRRTYPQLFVLLGNENYQVSDEDTDKVSEALEDCRNLNRAYVGDNVAEIVETKSDSQLDNIQPVWDMFLKKLIAVLDTPQYDWDSSGTEATAKERTKSFNAKIEWLQRAISTQFEKLVYAKLFNTPDESRPPVQIIFQKVSKADFYEDIKAYSMAVSFGWMTPNEARARLSMPPMSQEQLSELKKFKEIMAGPQKGNPKDASKARGPDEIKAAETFIITLPEEMP